MMLFSIREFCKNGHREINTFLFGVKEAIFTPVP